MAFAPGDIVQLKSGSPALTVVTASEAEISVIWYAEDVSEFRKDTLPTATVEKLDVADFDEEDDEDEEEEDEDED